MSQNLIEQTEISIEQAKEMVELGRALQTLRNNPHFKKIVTEGYFQEEAARLALIFKDPRFPDPKLIENDLVGIGAFYRYLDRVEKLGQMAQHELGQLHETLDELRAEELEGEVLN